MAGRLIVLDEGLPGALAGELCARGREATTVAELDLAGAPDADVLAAVAARDGVFVSPYPLSPRGARLAVIAAADPGARRDAVHRHAAAIAAQRATVRRYA